MSTDLFEGVMPFVTTVEAGSLTRAASRLSVSPSAVSRALTRLERQLGVRLLNRTARTVSLTPEGAAFLRECQTAVSAMRTARSGASAAVSSVQGTLRVSLPLALGELVVAPALPRLLGRHPGLSVEANLSDRLVDLAAERYDVALRIGRVRTQGLRQHRLPAVEWATVAAPAYLATHGVPQQPADLQAHNCLRFIRPTGTPQPWQFGRGLEPPERVNVSVTGTLASDHPGGLLQAALSGLGVLQAHHYAVAAPLADGRLVEVLAAFAPPALPMAVVFAEGRARLPAVRAFIAAMDELFAK